MSTRQAGLPGRGNQADYVLGTSEGWDAFHVVRWHAVEEIGRPYEYEITLMRAVSSGPVDLDGLIDAGATFRVAAQTRWRSVHGIVAEAEELDRTSQIILYRVLLVPHFWHARYRRRCRNFVGKTLRDIISAVLENRSPAHPEGMGGLTRYTSAPPPDDQASFDAFTAPRASYRWDVKAGERLQDPSAYPYVAQYNESDFDFVARLLEQEGLSYTFEHGRDEVVLAITDRPGVSPLFDPGDTFDLRRLSRSGVAANTEILRSFRDARRLRSRAVTMRDWDYNRSATPLQAGVDGAPGDADLTGHFEFPAGEESVQSQPGLHAAQVRIQRYDAERALREGSSTVRTMEPGRRFTMHDADGVLADAKVLAVRVETFATELVPEGTLLDEEPFGFANAPGPLAAGYDSRFLALPEAVPFRPAMRTPRPRIHGVQAAVVTAEEYPTADRPAINADSQARVRVRFPWDQRDDKDDATPTSDWIRVSHFWGGAGYGALYHPRVGHEMLVAYMQGDPDRPVVVGRVYNATHPPPYDASKEPTKSTVKGQSAEVKKEVDGFNEIRFEDKAKQEEIYLHAQRDLNEVVLASHSTSVGGDQSNSVEHDQSNTVKGHRDHSVTGYEKVTVTGDRTTIFQSNESHAVTDNRNTGIGANETLDVKGTRTTHVVGVETLHVEASRHTAIDAADKLHVGHNRSVFVQGQHHFMTDDTYRNDAADDHVFSSTNATFTEGSTFKVTAGGCTFQMSPGSIILSNGAGATIAMIGGIVVVTGGAVVSVKSGGPLQLTAAADISGKAPTIKWNG